MGRIRALALAMVFSFFYIPATMACPFDYRCQPEDMDPWERQLVEDLGGRVYPPSDVQGVAYDYPDDESEDSEEEESACGGVFIGGTLMTLAGRLASSLNPGFVVAGVAMGGIGAVVVASNAGDCAEEAEG